MYLHTFRQNAMIPRDLVRMKSPVHNGYSPVTVTSAQWLFTSHGHQCTMVIHQSRSPMHNGFSPVTVTSAQWFFTTVTSAQWLFSSHSHQCTMVNPRTLTVHNLPKDIGLCSSSFENTNPAPLLTGTESCTSPSYIQSCFFGISGDVIAIHLWSRVISPSGTSIGL